MAARRAVIRWALRTFRREWRQHTLVLGLITVAIAATVLGSTVAYNLAPAPTERFGRADLLVRLEGSDPDAIERDLEELEDEFGRVDVIARRLVQVPGSAGRLEIRAQQPQGVYGEPLLALDSGRYPAQADELAVTDGVAELLDVRAGDQAEIEGDQVTIVGLIENPSDLADEFALAPPDLGKPPEQVTVLVGASRDRFDAFRRASEHSWDYEWRARQDVATAAAVLGLATVGLLLISLVAAAGFFVLAQRRVRQLGMLTAIGATEKQLRLVTVVDGAIVGAVAAIVGTVFAVLGWVGLAPALESVAGHRIESGNIPWWVVGIGMLLAVLTATLAAWWPARSVARLPVMQALADRPNGPGSPRRSAFLGGLLVAGGVASLATADQSNGFLVVVGTVATLVGVLLLGPLMLRLLARAAKHLPLAQRLAARDMARYQLRSGAALAAISLALGIPAAVAITASAAEYGADEGNLSDRQMMIRILDAFPDEPLAPVRSPETVQLLDEQVERIAGELGDATVVPLEMPVESEVEPSSRAGEGREGGLVALGLGYRVDAGGTYRSVVGYVATPEVLAHYGIDPASIDPSIDILTTRRNPMVFASAQGRSPDAPEPTIQRIDAPAFTSGPTSLVTVDAMERLDANPVRTGWLVESDEALTDEQRATARRIAAAAGLNVETRFDERRLPVLRSAATVTGMLLAFGVLAMTVGLIRSETAGDLRTLAATGASSRVRRGLTASTAGALALLGVALGTIGAYVGLAAGYLGDLEVLSHVPVVHLVATVVGVPLVAALAGWILAGREPSALARRAID